MMEDKIIKAIQDSNDGCFKWIVVILLLAIALNTCHP